MKKKVVLAVASVATVGLAAFALWSTLGRGVIAPELNASLGSSGASIDDGPIGTSSSSYNLSAHQTLSRVILLIRENYVEPDRIKPYKMFLAALDYIQKTVPEVLVDDSKAPDSIEVAVGTHEQSFDLGGLDQLWEVTMALRDIFRFLQTQITDSNERRDIEYAAINGMLSTLDPHSVLLKPESFNEVKLSTKGEFGGLGIVISIRNGTLTIISPIEDTPAARAGLKAKDKVVKIDEESTINMGLEEAVRDLRGKPGSKVAIWVMRKNWTEPRRFVLTRAIIKIESVTSKLLPDGIGYVRIKSFQNNTYDDLHASLEKLRAKNKGELKGLVLDLRNNPGGLLDQAILVSDRFIDHGALVITVGEGNRKRDVRPAHFSGTETAYPIVVLANGGSASASEIVAGALKNHNRAVILGQQTFGKGSVQVLYDFKDKSALKLTIAQYLTPGDISIQSVGITPDVRVKYVTVAKNNIHLFAHDDMPREKDLLMHLSRHDGKAATGGPAASLMHLVADDDPDPGDEDDDTDEPFKYDFETHLAHDILVQAKAPDRPTVLHDAAQLLAARADQEAATIGKKLAALGADWSEAPDEGSPRAQLTLKSNVGSDGTIAAGATLTISATVKNTGDAPLYRVHGVTKSDNPLLDRLELVFGKIPAGASRSWSVAVKLPQDMGSRADNFTLHLDDLYHHTQQVSATSFVSITEQPKPRFSLRYRIDDAARGNGDGVLQVGEHVALDVNVTNLGPGASSDAVVTLKNLSGAKVFLERGRDKLGALPVGASRSGQLRFVVHEPTDTAKLRVSVWDGNLGATLADEIHLPVQKGQRVEKRIRGLRVGAKAVPVYAGASDAMPVIGQAQPGALLRSNAAVGAQGHWRRVVLAGDNVGFVRSTDVSITRPVHATSKNAVRLAAGEAPPRVDLDLNNLVTSADTMHLTGSVSDSHALEDMFAFVGEKKVYYHALDDVKPDASGRYRTPVSIALPLKKGSNVVTLVVRENDSVVSRRVFGVLRTQSNPVAERSAARAATSPTASAP